MLLDIHKWCGCRHTNRSVDIFRNMCVYTWCVHIQWCMVWDNWREFCRHELTFTNLTRPRPHGKTIESPSRISASSSSSDSSNYSTDSETTSRDTHVGSSVSGSSRSFFSSWTRKKSIQDAMKALDSISLFIDTDKENYCFVNNVLPVVMKQTEKWIEKERNGSFGHWRETWDRPEYPNIHTYLNVVRQFAGLHNGRCM